MPKNCQGTKTELHDAINLLDMLQEEYDTLRLLKRPCLRTVAVLDLCLMRASTIVANIKREFYGDNFSHFDTFSHFPDDNGGQGGKNDG